MTKVEGWCHIPPNSRPSVSLLVMVRMKYGILAMCIDYWEVNKRTIKIGIPFQGLMRLWMKWWEKNNFQR